MVVASVTCHSPGRTVRPWPGFSFAVGTGGRTVRPWPLVVMRAVPLTTSPVCRHGLLPSTMGVLLVVATVGHHILLLVLGQGGAVGRHGGEAPTPTHS